MAIKVQMIAHTPEPEKVIAASANLCYNAIGASEIYETLTDKKVESLVSRMVASGHHSTLEHVSFTFAIEGISRACTHQLVRHRIASYSQQSQRYVKAGGFKETAIKPNTIAKNPEANAEFDKLMDQVAEVYNKLVELGVPAEDARFVLPNAAETKIVVTMNARSLLHFFEERCCTRAQWEIRTMANMMLAQCKEVAPILFANAGPTCVTQLVCHEGKMSCGRLEGILAAKAKEEANK